METPSQLYKIRDLVLLPELNPRAQLCEETIIRYMESFEALPPVSIQEGTGVLVDGFHRVEAATRLGVEAIPVRMLDIPDEELHLYAGLANCSHGRPMSRAERNRFVVRLVEEYGWPSEKVARVAGVSASSVALAAREHRYNRELSERLGEEVQVVNSSHVQALYRVGDEQRARLLDAVAGKTDDEGRPRPLTGTELKSLVDLMEDPATPAEELQRLFEDPLARPLPSGRRRPASADAEPVAARERPVSEPAPPREVERRGPLYTGEPTAASNDDQRARILERALTPSDEGVGAGRTPDEERHGRRSDVSRSDNSAPWEEDDPRPLRPASERRPPLGLDASEGWREPRGAEPAAPVAILERTDEGRGPLDALREAERLLSDLCSRVEDAEIWEQLREARDLVREAAELI